jgi:hypothetical protein
LFNNFTNNIPDCTEHSLLNNIVFWRHIVCEIVAMLSVEIIRLYVEYINTVSFCKIYRQFRPSSSKLFYNDTVTRWRNITISRKFYCTRKEISHKWRYAFTEHENSSHVCKEANADSTPITAADTKIRDTCANIQS